LTVFFQFLELRHKVELHNLTGRVVECPLDELNRASGVGGPAAADPADRGELEQLLQGGAVSWVACCMFGPAARNYAVARLVADVGVRINEAGCSTWTTCGGSWAGSAS
jgi:hypothetical protein